MGQTHPRYVVWAAQDGRVEDLRFHLGRADKAALLPYQNSPKKQTPLHYAVSRGHTQCVKVLCEAGSDVNARDKDSYTALHLATFNQHYSSVQLLLQMGAHVNSSSRFGVTALHLAASVGHTPCAELLVRWGADVDAREAWGQTPLAIATLRGRIPCMHFLLQAGAQRDIPDHMHSQTPLHIACASKDEERVLVLLDAGCDLQATNIEGLTPLGVAIANKFYRVVPLLLEYGAVANEKDKERMSEPLQKYINRQTGSPPSLLRLCRVCVRESLGPSRVGQLSELGLSQAMETFLGGLLDLCEGERVRRKALEGRSTHSALRPELQSYSESFD